MTRSSMRMFSRIAYGLRDRFTAAERIAMAATAHASRSAGSGHTPRLRDACRFLMLFRSSIKLAERPQRWATAAESEVVVA